MPNTYFQFKQFTIHQDQCAMKVSTEACILGAWVPDSLPKRVLDIGTGTGLLALMLAQRMAVPIDAVELDEEAAKQAMQNVSESPWPDRISVITGSIFDYAKTSAAQYDLIISNPPFFSNSLKSESENKNRAKHDTSEFNKINLVLALKDLLSPNGEACILYPEHEAEQFRLEAEKEGLNCSCALIIRNQPNGPIFRVVSRVTKYLQSVGVDELNIREREEHTRDFVELLRPYYLRY